MRAAKRDEKRVKSRSPYDVILTVEEVNDILVMDEHVIRRLEGILRRVDPQVQKFVEEVNSVK